MTVASIHLHSLPFAWPVLWPMLEKAARLVDLTEIYVRREIERGHAELWAIREDGKPIAVVTQVTLEPEKRCLIWIVGGTRVREWMGTFMPKIEGAAREWGCVAIWASGRHGWKHIAAALGFNRIEDAGNYPAWERRL
jgi:hypothetical protein